MKQMCVMIGLLLATCLGLFSHAAAGQAFDREAAYKQQVDKLQAQINARPDDADALVALASFYLKPVVMRRVQAADGQMRSCPAPLRDEVVVDGIKEVYAVPWVFRGDPAAAAPLLDRALIINPNHHQAIRQAALLYRMRQDVVNMQRYVLKALEQDPIDLDMARLYLDYHTVQARICNDQAAALRTPRSHEEDRADGRYRVTTYPSEADKARANQLDEQAQSHRHEAIKPLMHLAKTLKDDPLHKSTYDLANAIYYHWIGKLDTAGGAAKAALAADPTNLDALDYLIDLTRGTHTKDLYDYYRTIRDRWAGGDTKIRSAPAAPRKPKA